MSGGWLVIPALVAGLLLFWTGCATAPDPSPDSAAAPGGFAPTPGAPFDPPAGPEPPPAAGPVGLDRAPRLWPDVLARVNGEPVGKRELAEFLCVSDPKLARLLVDDLAKLRILRAEVKRLGVVIPEELVRSRMAKIDREVEETARRSEKDAARFIEERFGISLEVFRELQRIKLRTLLAQERVVRYSRILDDVVEGRMIVVEDRGEAERIVGQLQQGADFATLARRVSIHPSKARGGSLPPVGRWGVQKELEERLFALEPGRVSAPVEVTEEGRTLWVVLKSVRRIPARQVRYAEVKDEIERGLAERPFEDLEADGWVQNMMKRYEVEILIPAPQSELLTGQEKK